MSVSSEIKASKREQAALLLAIGRSAAQAAAGVGVTKRTVQRWLAKNPVFAARVAAVRAGLLQRSGRVLAHCTMHPATGLGRLVESTDARVALAAARSVGLTETIQEAVEFKQRLVRMEQQLGGAAVNP